MRVIYFEHWHRSRGLSQGQEAGWRSGGGWRRLEGGWLVDRQAGETRGSEGEMESIGDNHRNHLRARKWQPNCWKRGGRGRAAGSSQRHGKLGEG